MTQESGTVGSRRCVREVPPSGVLARRPRVTRRSSGSSAATRATPERAVAGTVSAPSQARTVRRAGSNCTRRRFGPHRRIMRWRVLTRFDGARGNCRGDARGAPNGDRRARAGCQVSRRSTWTPWASIPAGSRWRGEHRRGARCFAKPAAGASVGATAEPGSARRRPPGQRRVAAYACGRRRARQRPKAHHPAFALLAVHRSCR